MQGSSIQSPDLDRVLNHNEREGILSLSLWDWSPPTDEMLSVLSKAQLLKFDNLRVEVVHPGSPDKDLNWVRVSLKGVRARSAHEIRTRIRDCLYSIESSRSYHAVKFACNLERPSIEQETVYFNHLDQGEKSQSIVFRYGIVEETNGQLTCYMQQLLVEQSYVSEWVHISRDGTCEILPRPPEIRHWVFIHGESTIRTPKYHLVSHFSEFQQYFSVQPILNSEDDGRYGRYAVRIDQKKNYPWDKDKPPFDPVITHSSGGYSPEQAKVFLKAMSTAIAISEQTDRFLTDPMLFVECCFSDINP